MSSLTEEEEEENADTPFSGMIPEESNSRILSIFGPTIGGVLLLVFEIIQIVVVSAIIIVPIRYFLVQPFYVRGASMEPTFFDREYLLIDEISYRFHEPHRGDVIVFRYPRDPSEFFIKRIVGVPGDTIDVKDGKVVITNESNPGGVILTEEYIGHILTSGDKHVTLNPDEYFLFGDNRSASLDSRSFGPVKKEYFVGRVWLRGLPVSAFRVFDTPIYDELEQ